MLQTCALRMLGPPADMSIVDTSLVYTTNQGRLLITSRNQCAAGAEPSTGPRVAEALCMDERVPTGFGKVHLWQYQG
jgi:hypothetical protein